MIKVFLVAKEFPELGVRYLDGPERPLRWVAKPEDAARFQHACDIIEQNDLHGAYAVEVEGA